MKYLVFLDIDGTLLDLNYSINSEEVFNTIKDREREGFVFGMNSNRAYEDIESLYEKFNLNGPIIGENGAFAIVNKKLLEFTNTKNQISTLKTKTRSLAR